MSRDKPDTREDSTHGHQQMVNTKIRLIIFFAATDGEALYSQQKQDRELTVAQIMNSLLPNSDLTTAALNLSSYYCLDPESLQALQTDPCHVTGQEVNL